MSGPNCQCGGNASGNCGRKPEQLDRRSFLRKSTVLASGIAAIAASLAPLRELSVSRFFWIFAALMAGAAVVFAILSYFYKGKTYLQDSA